MDDDPDLQPSVLVFRGTRRACAELSLVFEARDVPYELAEEGASWALCVAPEFAARARDELRRYSRERRSDAQRQREREELSSRKPFGGAYAGSLGYALVLFLVAYAVGDSTFGIDWVEAGALQVPAPGHAMELWRAITSLTLHQSPDHLFSNLAFGIAGGVLCTRLFGYGIGWLGILVAGILANLVEMGVGPQGHAAIGASTAVFGSIGLLSGYAWRQRLTLRERWLYRWAPLIGGVSLLAALGAGSEHVDVLGHLLGFLVGVVLGWVYALAGIPRTRHAAPQNLAAGIGALLIVGGWVMALGVAGAQH
jgi:membrane associated rhomboid family serine protease